MLELVGFGLMVGIDILFVAVLFLVMLPLGMYRSAAFAVMKRNFVGYFSNPTGYVFLCLFVLLTAFAAFWPHEFFTANLANFDQLNKFLPYIMLVFIPAITMSIWAEERRQGTDELLLTFPARDFDIVIGKYFAAVLIFTVSLLFSQLSNYAVLIAMTGGELDPGLLFSTYLGYWFIGIAMLAIGMVASFLTNNLTIGFIFGAAFNAPLAFFSNADVIVSNNQVVRILFEWSLLQRFETFGRGLIALSSIIYFVGIALLGVYLSLVLIGRRHWMGGKDGSNMLGHYMIRTVMFVLLAISSVVVAQYSPLNRLRLDVSEQKVSTLSNVSRVELVKVSGNNVEETITIDCFISDNIPTEYVQTKYELINRLREFDALGGSRVKVNISVGISPVGKEANRAAKRFGIRAVPVNVTARGSQRTEMIIMGVAVTSGLNRMVIPFFDYGMAVEYELLRAINTLDQEERKTVGLVLTDVMPYGSLIVMGNTGIQLPPMRFIDEIKKQYNVELISATSPIPVWVDESGKEKKRRFDALLVIQPSKMSQAELDNLVAAIETGQPTAIFEDPAPLLYAVSPNRQSRPQPYINGTDFPRLPILRRENSPAQDQCNIEELYRALGISLDGYSRQGKFFTSTVVSEIKNPYQRAKQFEDDNHVLIRDAGLGERFNPDDRITKEIKEVCLIRHGSIGPLSGYDNLEYTMLVQSPVTSWAQRFRIPLDKSETRQNPRTVAARLKGSNNRQKPVDVVYVSDIDLISNQFVQWRDRPNLAGADQPVQIENIQFAMNVIDSLAGEEHYFDIRNRRIRHSTLTKIDEVSAQAWNDFDRQLSEIEINIAKSVNEVTQETNMRKAEIESQIRRIERRKEKGETIDAGLMRQLENTLQQVNLEKEARERKVSTELQEEGAETLRQIYLDSETLIQDAQNRYKLAAVTYPAIPPLLVGLIVFVRRRLRERSGISKARRLK